MMADDSDIIGELPICGKQSFVLIMTQNNVSLYLHIPFCRTICTYCAFNTYVGLDDQIAPFVAALAQEIRWLADHGPDMHVGTIYFGGGTPSLLLPEHYELLFQTLYEKFMIEPDAEISLEANPNDLNRDYLTALRGIGFNRISIGMQSAQPTELELFHRRHDVPMVASAVEAARGAGFDNLNLDLIFGIPNQTMAGWQETLDHALALKPQHFSLYGLELKGGTALTKDVKAGLLPTPDDDLAADMYEWATSRLPEMGFQQYEISNWCLPGYEARHNLQYWRNLPYAGLGPGAHGYLGGARTIVMRSPERYIQAMQTSPAKAEVFPRTPAISKLIAVNAQEEMSETIMMGLRLTREGIERDVFQSRFGIDFVEKNQAAVDRFVRRGLLHVDDTRVRLTEQGRFVSNAIIRDLM
jgi:oxygen-independent coproporphyrinogen-3 oxidase